ncbi:MAG: hypothetical protein DGJ47_000781 [Rickettsiaceae bacterium]
MVLLFMKIIRNTALLFISFILAACDASNLGIMANQKANNVNVAILLPTTGPDAIKGIEYIAMIKRGLQDGAKIPIRITTYDSASPTTLDNSLNEIVQRGTDIIIGPMYTQPTKIVAQKIQGTGIIAFSLSNNPSLANEQTYVFGHAPMRQLQELLRYSLENDYDNYITLLPEGKWSERTNTIITNLVKNKGKNMVMSQYYLDNSLTDINSKIEQVSHKVDELNENPDNDHKPVIILSDDNENLDKLLNVVKSYQLDKKAVLVSDNRLNFNEHNNVDVVYTGSMNLIRKNFFNTAKQAKIHNISFMHYLSYDVGMMISSYVGKNYNRNNFINKINSDLTFDGLSGKTHFIDKIAQRKYEIIEKKNSKFSQL